MICRKVFFLAGLTLCVSSYSPCQTVTSARNGSWNDPATWEGGSIPTISNASLVRVLHQVVIDNGEVQSYSLEVSGKLEIAPPATLHVLSFDGVNGLVSVSGGSIHVNGTMTGVDGVKYQTSSANTRFYDGSYFRLRGGPKAYIPFAQWDLASTFLIEGFKTSGYVALAYSDGWKQSFGNVIYDCPLQTTFVDLNGHLKNIRGNFTISNTNSNALRFCTTQKPLITVGGNLKVEGPSELWFNTTSDSARFFIGGDLVYNSTSTGPSYLATRGRSFVRVGGKMSVNSSGPLRICSGSADSTGVRKTTFEISKDLELIRGTLIAPSPGKGIIILNGSSNQSVTSSAPAFNGYFDFHFRPGSVVDLGTSVLAGGGNIYVKGHLKLGSLSALGPLHPTTGNITTTGIRSFYSGATIEYNGNGDQFIGTHHPDHSQIGLICNNPTKITLLKNVLVSRFQVAKGKIIADEKTLTIHGDLNIYDSIAFGSNSTFRFAGTTNQNISFSGSTVDKMILAKATNTNVNLLTNVSIRKKLSIENPSNDLNSNGKLLLMSVSDEPDGTAIVSRIPDGSHINGEVIVQRFMSGEGRIYRYVSSAVNNATVADMKDDFPVTGMFKDPSKGKGLNTSGPSLYFYDESIVDPMESAWRPYPLEGYAAENTLVPGRGYAAYIRAAKKATVWDVRGLLNQGQIDLPVQFTPEAKSGIKGWNLIGNPYASPIDWTKVEGWNRSGDIGVPFAIRDNAAGKFHYYDGQVGDLTSGVISSGQSFWIRTSAPDPFVKINEEAKAETDAPFYKQEHTPVDYVRLELTSGNISDNIFIRQRSSALRSLDVFDAIKMSNDSLNFSVLSANSVKLSISALDSFRCEEEFQLVIDFPKKADGNYLRSPLGEHRLSILPFGLFKQSRLLIRDKFSNRISDSSNYFFSITEDSLSQDPLRFSLLISSPRSAITSAELMPFDCRDSVINIRVDCRDRNTQSFVAWSGLRYHSEIVNDTTSRIKIPALSFGYGKSYKLTIQGASLCETRALDTVAFVRDRIPDTPEIKSAVTCNDSTVRLSVRGMPSRSSLNLYKSFLESHPFFSALDSSFTITNASDTPLMMSIVSKSGCESDRKVVKVHRLKVEPLVIRFSFGDLSSNYRNNAWSFDGTLISVDSLAAIHPEKDGEYIARTNFRGCTLQSSYQFKHGDYDGVDVGPVPFDESIRIRSRDQSKISEVQVVSLDGRVFSNTRPMQETVVISTQHLEKGIYVVEVVSEGRKSWVKIVK